MAITQYKGTIQRPGQRPETVEIAAHTVPQLTRAEQSAGLQWVDGRYPEGNVLRYGENTTPGTTDMTTAIQNALDVAKLAKIPCHIPGGYYAISQIEVPNGIIVHGDGIGEFGIAGDADNVTVLQQIDGTEDDMVIFKPTDQDGFLRLWNGGIRDLILMGDSTATTGHGISFRNNGTRTTDANHAILAGHYFLENLLIRQFPEDGVYLRRSATGNTAFRNVATYFNGGYGFNIDTTTGLTLLLDNCGGDGNTGGATFYISTTIRDACVTIINPWSEYRDNSVYGDTAGFESAQPYNVEIGDFGSTANVSGVVNIIGGNSVASVTSPAVHGIDAAVYVNCTSNDKMPEIAIIGHQVIDEKTPTITSGNNDLLYDALNSTRITSDIKTAYYTRRPNNVNGKALLTGAGHVVAGGDGVYGDIGVGESGIQAKGATAAFSLFESDASADEGIASIVQSGGDTTFRTVSDAGSANIEITISRSGNDVLYTRFHHPIRVSNTTSGIYSGSGTPESNVNADVGSIYLRTDGGASTSLYVKESGTGNTGWVAK